MSVCLSQQSTAACSGTAADFAEHPLGRRYQSTAVGALQAQAAGTGAQQQRHCSRHQCPAVNTNSSILTSNGRD